MSRSGLQLASSTPGQGAENTNRAQDYRATTVSRADTWDSLAVAGKGGLLQSWRWGEFKKASGWSASRLVVQRSESANGVSPDALNQPLMCAQVLFRPVPKLPLPISIAYLPRGPLYLSRSAADRHIASAFWQRMHKLARRRGAIFLKAEPDITLNEQTSKAEVDRTMIALGFQPSGRLQPARTIVLDLEKSEADLLASMKPKTRYNLRLAGRRGVQARRAETLADLESFYRLLEVTGNRDEFGIHTLPYYEQMWRTFGPEGDNSVVVLLADHPDASERERRPIAGLLALRFGREAIYMYGASDNRGREHMPNYLLQWEAIKWARQHGCTRYDFWGIPDAPSEGDVENEQSSATNARSGLRGVYWFKKGFGGVELEYPGAYDYVYNPVLYKLWMRWRGASLG